MSSEPESEPTPVISVATAPAIRIEAGRPFAATAAEIEKKPASVIVSNSRTEPEIRPNA